MIDYSYLERGWTGLSNAFRAGSMSGHLGAGVIAGYCFAERRADLDPAIYPWIQRDLDRLIAGEEDLWFNPSKAGISIDELFSQSPDDEAAMPVEEARLEIATAMTETMGGLRQSGHNLIFGSLMLRVLQDHPDLANRGSVTGMVKLLNLFRGTRPGRGYYGKETGWRSGETIDLSGVGIPDYATPAAMAGETIRELIRSAAVRNRGFGGLFHLIDHAAALVELHQDGFPELAGAGIPAHRDHFKYLRTLPDLETELGPLEKASNGPGEPAYWARTESSQWSAWLSHRLKVLYGYEVLISEVEDPETISRANEAMKYLLA